MVLTLDTNVLVRVFMDDASAPAQVEAARACAKKASEIYVPQIIQAELVWVLTTAYQLKKEQVLAVLRKLYSHSIFSLQQPTVFKDAVSLYESGTADFSDYLIALEAKSENALIYSFNKKLIKTKFAVECKNEK